MTLARYATITGTAIAMVSNKMKREVMNDLVAGRHRRQLVGLHTASKRAVSSTLQGVSVQKSLSM